MYYGNTKPHLTYLNQQMEINTQNEINLLYNYYFEYIFIIIISLKIAKKNV